MCEVCVCVGGGRSLVLSGREGLKEVLGTAVWLLPELVLLHVPESDGAVL